MQQRAERRYVDCFFGDGHISIVDRDVVDAIRRALVREAGARDQLIGSGQVAQDRRAWRPVKLFPHRSGRYASKFAYRHGDHDDAADAQMGDGRKSRTGRGSRVGRGVLTDPLVPAKAGAQRRIPLSLE